MKSRILLAARATALAATLAACGAGGIDGLGDPTKCGMTFDQRNCVALAVESGGAAVLEGDTIRLFSMSDSDYAASVTWEVSESGAIVPNSEMEYVPIFYRTGRSILMRGIEPGDATVTVIGADGHHRATTHVPVVDSSTITSLEFFVVSVKQNAYTATTTVAVGDSLWVDATPLDAQGRRYAAHPDSLWSSDTAIAKLVSHPALGPLPAATWLVGRAAGSVNVVAAFLEVRDTVRITVVKTHSQ
jgi:hypothetical protein